MTVKSRDRTGRTGADAQHFSSEFHRLSQDLRTPLNAISGFAELLLLDKGLNPTSADYARAIMTASETLRGAVVSYLERSEMGEHGPVVLPRFQPEGEAPPPAPRRSPFKYVRQLASPRRFRAVKA